MISFWDKLPKPFFVLAPLADVTDAAFRRVIAKYSRMGQVGGGPDAMWTEFVSADGLFMADEVGREKLMKDLIFTEDERPIVAQFFTAKPEMMERAARLAAELSFDGVDINMGCPDRSIEKQGAGAALMKNPNLAVEVIEAAKKGAGRLPVSVKTRIGYSENEMESWLPKMLSAEPVALTVHFRTRREMSKVPAHWELAGRVVEIRDGVGSKTLILGNGDVLSLTDAEKKVKETGLDGVMLGKAIFGNPWLFSKIDSKINSPNKKSYDTRLAVGQVSYDLEIKDEFGDGKSVDVDTKEKLRVMVEHTKLFEELLGDVKNFSVMKKHFKAYVQGWSGAKELRMKLMEAKDASEVEEVVNNYLGK